MKKPPVQTTSHQSSVLLHEQRIVLMLISQHRILVMQKHVSRHVLDQEVDVQIQDDVERMDDEVVVETEFLKHEKSVMLSEPLGVNLVNSKH